MQLKHYETLYLMHSGMSEDDRSAFGGKLQGIITQSGGQVVVCDSWPLQRLAYKVRRQTQGYYVLLEYGAPANVISDITRELRLNDQVLKFLTIKHGDKFDAEAILNAKQSVSAESVSLPEAALETISSEEEG
ncbi:MAG: 30S ribosomal protein S6 [Dissulfuribacterales bacterium]